MAKRLLYLLMVDSALVAWTTDRQRALRWLRTVTDAQYRAGFRPGVVFSVAKAHRTTPAPGEAP